MSNLRRRQVRLVPILFLVVTAGCYRAVYANLEPPSTEYAAQAAARPTSSWRSFYLYGYLPPELAVDAAAECGGAGRVREIRTRQTFTQGLIRIFATSSGVNAYAPWTGEVVCNDHH